MCCQYNYGNLLRLYGRSKWVGILGEGIQDELYEG